VKHQGFAVTIFSCKESVEAVAGAELGTPEPARNLARGERGDFELDQAIDSTPAGV